MLWMTLSHKGWAASPGHYNISSWCISFVMSRIKWLTSNVRPYHFPLSKRTVHCFVCLLLHPKIDWHEKLWWPRWRRTSPSGELMPQHTATVPYPPPPKQNGHSLQMTPSVGPEEVSKLLRLPHPSTWFRLIMPYVLEGSQITMTELRLHLMMKLWTGESRGFDSNLLCIRKHEPSGYKALSSFVSDIGVDKIRIHKTQIMLYLSCLLLIWE